MKISGAGLFCSRNISCWSAEKIGEILLYWRIPRRGLEIKAFMKNILDAFSEKYWSSCRYKGRFTCSSGSAFALVKKLKIKKNFRKNISMHIYKVRIF